MILERWGVKFVTQTPKKSFHVHLGISKDVQSFAGAGAEQEEGKSY